MRRPACLPLPASQFFVADPEFLADTPLNGARIRRVAEEVRIRAGNPDPRQEVSG
jgi:hypothetical protein